MAARGFLPLPVQPALLSASRRRTKRRQAAPCVPALCVPSTLLLSLSPNGTQCPGCYPVPRWGAPGLLKMGSHMKDVQHFLQEDRSSAWGSCIVARGSNSGSASVLGADHRKSLSPCFLIWNVRTTSPRQLLPAFISYDVPRVGPCGTVWGAACLGLRPC